jgi:hypothetical protein
MATTFDEVKDMIDANEQGDFYGTIKWYYDQGKVDGDEEEGYYVECMICHQQFWNEDCVGIIRVAEGCRNAHVHQLDAYTKQAPQW